MSQTNVGWRCEHPDTGDVKFACHLADKNILVDWGYVCVLAPDVQFDEHDTKFGPVEDA